MCILCMVDSVDIQLLTKLSNWLTIIHAYSEVTIYGWHDSNIQLRTNLTTIHAYSEVTLFGWHYVDIQLLTKLTI